ncbi:MAG TPA: CvpA family protein [Candidatus Aminicenantes bacterium]|nr:CvpA family protein [Acidobacteriota bacterium]HOI44774.1 CvpA family protein [Candidatus Aminicenantes bacterium]
MNWLDVAFLVIVLVAVVFGLIKGFVRELIGLASVILGFVLAALYYPALSGFMKGIINHPLAANFLAFLAIFLGVILAGSVISFLLTKIMKSLKVLAWINHLMGGLFGLIKSVVICGILVMAMLAFQFQKETLRNSKVAPLCYQAARALVYLVPEDFRAKFQGSYEEIRKGGKSHGQKI